MKASELRIGNYLTYSTDHNRFFKAEGKDIVFCQNFNLEDGKYRYEPITLTEEWLVKFGFKSNNQTDGFWFPQTNLWIRLQKGRFTAHLQHDKLTNIENVHQLQNLYFALTGEELTIIESPAPYTDQDNR